MMAQQKIDSYEAAWDPRAYWEEYYSGDKVPSDEIAMFRFCVDLLQEENRSYPEMLDVGCGPTVHRMVPFAKYVDRIHLSDYLQINLDEVNRWLQNDEGALNWDKFIKVTLEMEGENDPGPADIEERKRLLRTKTGKLIQCDLGRMHPLGMRTDYPLVTSFLCVDAISTSKKIWQTFMRNLSNVVAPEGTLILTSLGDSRSYHVGTKCFPSANLNQDEVYHSLLSLGFKKEAIFMRTTPLEDKEHASYADLGHIIMAVANK